MDKKKKKIPAQYSCFCFIKAFVNLCSEMEKNKLEERYVNVKKIHLIFPVLFSALLSQQLFKNYDLTSICNYIQTQNGLFK